jgi:hypothetical protein
MLNIIRIFFQRHGQWPSAQVSGLINNRCVKWYYFIFNTTFSAEMADTKINWSYTPKLHWFSAYRAWKVLQSRALTFANRVSKSHSKMSLSIFEDRNGSHPSSPPHIASPTLVAYTFYSRAHAQTQTPRPTNLRPHLLLSRPIKLDQPYIDEIVHIRPSFQSKQRHI